MPQKSETGRSGRMKNLTDTLRNLGAEALEKARLTPFLEKLEQENEVHFAAPSGEPLARGARVKGLLRAKRMATDAAYHTLVETVNALILVNGEAPYQAFTASLAGEISHAHTKLATRRTILAKHRAARKGEGGRTAKDEQHQYGGHGMEQRPPALSDSAVFRLPFFVSPAAPFLCSRF